MNFFKKALVASITFIATSQQTPAAIPPAPEELAPVNFFKDGGRSYFVKRYGGITVAMSDFIQDAIMFSTDHQGFLDHKVLSEQLATLTKELNRYPDPKYLDFSKFYNRQRAYNFNTQESINYAIFAALTSIKNKSKANLSDANAPKYERSLRRFFKSLGTNLTYIRLASLSLFTYCNEKKLDKSVAILLDFLCKNKKLKDIDLNDNGLSRLSDKQLIHFFATLAQELPELSSIDIGLNELSIRQLNLIRTTMQTGLDQIAPGKIVTIKNADNQEE